VGRDDVAWEKSAARVGSFGEVRVEVASDGSPKSWEERSENCAWRRCIWSFNVEADLKVMESARWIGGIMDRQAITGHRWCLIGLALPVRPRCLRATTPVNERYDHLESWVPALVK